jgi:dinuclear metal center YbgI/SA1388 family protein
MTVGDIIGWLETLAPPSLAESYDNVGLMTGDRSRPCHRVLLCLDVTEAVLEEAVQKGCDLIVSHHPPIFGNLRRVTEEEPTGRLLAHAIRSGLSLYAIHTNLDNVIGGINGWLADAFGLVDRSVLQPIPGRLLKLHTFVPEGHLPAVRKALFDAGAGHIGNYSDCSFSTGGTGTFRAGEGADPWVGAIGEDHQEPEQRLEVVLPAWRERRVVAALHAAHPYEEVAYDIVRLENTVHSLGAGLVGRLPEPLAEADLLRIVQERCGNPCIRHSRTTGRTVHRLALCGGAGAFLIPAALSSGADAYLTADLKYHDFFLPDGRMLLADIGHFESEQGFVEGIHRYLAEKFPTFAVRKSATATNPVNYHPPSIWPT